MKKLLYVLLGIFFTFGLIGFPVTEAKCDDGIVIIGDLTAHFIDVGQGDSCIIELPDDRTMLIDAGVENMGRTVESYINNNIKDKSGNAIKFIDFVVFTHSDADHIGGMSYVLSKFDVGTVYRSNEECKRCSDPALSGKEERNRFWGDKHGVKDTKTFHEAIARAYEVADEVIVTNPEDDEQNKIVSNSEKYYTISFYSPLSSYYTDLNNHSPIIVIEYRGRRIVLSGDAEEKNEKEFVERANQGKGKYSIFQNFCADVIKLGHHGSRTSNSEEYLDIMVSGGGRRDVFVIISCGEGNKYGHPHAEVLERLKKMGFSDERILRTDTIGDIVITIAEQDGMYKAFYAKSGLSSSNQSGGGEENETDIFESLIGKFNGLSLTQKILVIVIIIAIVIAVLAIAISEKKRRKRK